MLRVRCCASRPHTAKEQYTSAKYLRPIHTGGTAKGTVNVNVFFQCRGMSAAGLKGREACPLLPHKMTSSPMLPKQRYNRTTDRESPFPSPSPFVWLILYASHASERCLSAVRNMLLGDSWAPFQGGLSPVHSCRLLESRLAA